MAITNFVPEVWAAQLQTSFKKATVFASPSVVNRNYEGEISAAGDTVRITSISRPTIATYTKNSTSITPETLTDAARTLVVDQSKYFAFEVDDIDLRQSKNGGALMAEAATEAAYGLADTVDQYIAGLFSGVDSANAITTTSITTAALAKTGLVNLAKKLNEANVPRAGRFVIIPPWYEALLIDGSVFGQVDASGSSEGLREGYVTRAFGFDIFVSNNVTNTTGDDYRICAGVPQAITFADQINKVEAYRPESGFSDALKGLHVYGAKLTRPSGIATLIASIT